MLKTLLFSTLLATLYMVLAQTGASQAATALTLGGGFLGLLLASLYQDA